MSFAKPLRYVEPRAHTTVSFNFCAPNSFKKVCWIRGFGRRYLSKAFQNLQPSSLGTNGLPHSHGRTFIFIFFFLAKWLIISLRNDKILGSIPPFDFLDKMSLNIVSTKQNLVGETRPMETVQKLVIGLVFERSKYVMDGWFCLRISLRVHVSVEYSATNMRI